MRPSLGPALRNDPVQARGKPANPVQARGERADPIQAQGEPSSRRDAWFRAFFDDQFASLHRYLARFTGDPEVAGELAQEAFIRLYRRRGRPDQPRAWLFTVAMNLARNAKTKASRQRRLLTLERSTHVLSDPPGAPGTTCGSASTRVRVKRALAALSGRDRQLLLLRAEGYSYKDLAAALELNEASVGTLLSRAKAAFKDAYQEYADAP
ncbi:MAG: sigma-70 family RNA polymerase sigma factor [Gemmatimonadetes bacterium]|nr:sigma-70 family RNA polymerase sigma factor [Gemmatimonadota bacterium]